MWDSNAFLVPIKELFLLNSRYRSRFSFIAIADPFQACGGFKELFPIIDTEKYPHFRRDRSRPQSFSKPQLLVGLLLGTFYQPERVVASSKEKHY
jgi:hypothetical protein